MSLPECLTLCCLFCCPAAHLTRQIDLCFVQEALTPLGWSPHCWVTLVDGCLTSLDQQPWAVPGYRIFCCYAFLFFVQVLKDVLKLARRHEVGIDSSYAALVLGVCVIVGFATSLDGRINIMDAATPCFLQHSLTGKATGLLY